MLDDKHLLKPWDAKKVGVAPSPWSLLRQVFRGLHRALTALSTFFLLPSALLLLLLLPTSVL